MTVTLHELAAEGQVVGRRYHVPRFPLDPEVADRFAAVAGMRPSRLHALDVAHPCLVARPALCVLHAVLADPAVGAERSTMLHAQSDIVWHGPLRPGTDVELDAEILDAGPYGNRRGLVVATRVTALEERRALVDMTTVLAFAPPALAVAEGRDRIEVPERVAHDRRVVASRDVVLDEGFPARYAETSGDTNPIHLDDAAARAAGLPGVVLHGLSTVAVGATFAIDELAGGDPGALRRLRVRFARPARPAQIAHYAAHPADLVDHLGPADPAYLSDRSDRADPAEHADPMAGGRLVPDPASSRRSGPTATGGLVPGSSGDRRFVLSCRVGGSPIWRQAVVDIRS